MDWTRDGAGLWRRRLRTSWQALVWGLLCCLAGLLYGATTNNTTANNQPDATPMDVMSVLNVVLLFVGLCVVGLGVLGWTVSMVATRRYDRALRRQPPDPPRFVRLSVLPWALAVLCLAGALVSQRAPAVLCSVGAGTTVDVYIDPATDTAAGVYLTGDGPQPVVVQDATASAGDTLRACVGWLGSGRAWTRYPWSGLWLVLAVGVPLVVIEGALALIAVRGPGILTRPGRRRHSTV